MSNKDKLTLDVEKIKEVHELKEGCKYIIEIPEADHEQSNGVVNTLKEKFNIDCVVINAKIKIYEVKK